MRLMRLASMQAAMEPPPPQGITVARDGASAAVEGEDLALGLPGGRLLTRIAALWPFQAGRFRLPGGARVMVIPQKSYLPDGPLAKVLAYPEPVRDGDHARFARALTDCRLPQCTVVSVAHRTTLDAFHSHKLKLTTPSQG